MNCIKSMNKCMVSGVYVLIIGVCTTSIKNNGLFHSYAKHIALPPKKIIPLLVYDDDDYHNLEK